MQRFLAFSIFCITALMQLSAQSFSTDAAHVPDSLRSVDLGEVTIFTPKESGDIRQQPSAVSLIGERQMADNRVGSLKHLSALVPNFFVPDYGSRLTSAVYIRGVGSRINTPAVGLYVDHIPYVDKSAFDFNFYDIQRVDVLRGPQGTLYGRNTMGGLIRVHTKTPFSGTGTTVKMSAATGDAHRVLSVTHYHRLSDIFAFSAGGYLEGSNGFFHNDVSGEKIDGKQSGGGRIRSIYLPTEFLQLDFTVNYDYSDEGAYPYYYTGQLADAELYPHLVGKISNNREHRYRRGLFNAGLNTQYKDSRRRFVMNAVTGFQNLNDRMFLDQDFLSPDIYSLLQKQRVNTVTEEITFRSVDSPLREKTWEWVGGLSFMYQQLHTQAPVTFYQDGLRWLEGNINQNMPAVSSIQMLQMMGFESMGVNFRGDQLQMSNDFQTPTVSLAAYGQATYRFTPEFSVTAGLRMEHEHMRMDYAAPADVTYGFRMPNSSNPKMAVDLQQLESHIDYTGSLRDNYVHVLPKVAFRYEFDRRNNLYFSLSKGFRSGGYNLQMFSDLLQGALRVDMMEGVKSGVKGYMEELVATTSMPAAIPPLVSGIMDEKMPKFETPAATQVVYKPEYSWNGEVGTHLTLLDRTLQLDAATYLMLTCNQQIARFAASGMGRQMVNAGRSRSYGAEVSLRWTPTHHLALRGNYGYTHSTFTRYDGGVVEEDYAGHYVPFVPMHTTNLDAAYSWLLCGSWVQRITLGADMTGVGRIYWTERGDRHQPFYATLGARLSIDTPRCSFMIWARNLTSTRYSTFYFESAARGFCQRGRPFQMGVDIKANF